MRTGTLLKLSGMAAMAGGALRVVDSFTTGVPDAQLLAILYFVTDVLLLFGLTGWYLSRSGVLGPAGLVGYVVSIVAILIIRSASLFGEHGYALGAVVLLLGLATMSAPSLLRREGNRLPQSLWFAALIVGIASLALPVLAVAAGALFGLGFVMAGIELWRHADTA